MKVEVVYTQKSKYMKQVADEMARWVKTYAKEMSQHDYHQEIDLLVIGFDDSLFKDKELMAFIQSLNRQQVKNIALVNAFYLNTKKIHKMIQLCQQQDLPLMREQYSFKIKKHGASSIDQDIIDGARLYIEDMVNIVRNYY